MSSSGDIAPQASQSHPRRIQAFRDEMLRHIPRVPNNARTLKLATAMHTRRLLLAFVTWRMRVIPAKPRIVRIWGAITRTELALAKRDLEPFLQKVAMGADLNGHLSELVCKAGLIFPGARETARHSDIDSFLIRYGLYHFHLGKKHAGNPKGRSGRLVFAEVIEDEFRGVALSNHRAFDRADPEHMRLFQIARGYVSREVPAGYGFMTNPVMMSGHATNVVGFADWCEDRMRAIDPLLDDPAFLAKLYAEGKPVSDGGPAQAPERPRLKWCFHDLEFGVLDEATGVFFCFSPFFKR